MIPLFLLLLQSPLQIGTPTDLLPASKQFPGLPRAKVYPPKQGRTWITLYAGQPVFGPGKYILASDDVMPNPDGLPYSPQGELVEIQTWVGNKGYFPEGDQLWTKWRGKAAWLVKAPIQTGGSYSVETPTRFSCLDDVDIYVKAAPPGWNAPAFVEINFSRRVRIWSDYTQVVGAPLDTSAGMGYLCKVQRSTLVNAQGLRGDGVRHGFEAFGGAQMFCGGMEITNAKGTVWGSHGMGAVGLYAAGLKGDGDIAIGNAQGAYGDEAEVWMAQAKMLWLHGSSSVKVYDSKFSGPLGLMRNAFGEPRSVEATRCVFTAYSTAPAIYKASADLTVVPKLTLTTLVEFVPP